MPGRDAWVGCQTGPDRAFIRSAARVQVPASEDFNGARQEAGLEPVQAPAPAGAARPAAANTAALKVKVSLAPELAAKLPAGATVFVLARQPGGPPMPVAVEKHPARNFPLEVSLDDGDSPMPTMKLSQLPEVEIIARISASGIANRQDGDIELIESSDRAFRLALGGPEGGEVVQPEEARGCGLHQSDIEGPGHLPDMGAVEHGRAAPVEDAVAVVPAGGGVARVEVGADDLGAEDRHRVRAQVRVERVQVVQRRSGDRCGRQRGHASNSRSR